jgi:CheY-like chemotaxis protein
MGVDPVVLYVEDDLRSRKLMEFFLTKSMNLSNVTVFEDSAEFEKRLEALTPLPEVIFLDIHVKPFSGFEMLKVIRVNPALSHVPVVALTASVMNEEIQLLRSAGFDGCLAKPIEIETFPECLDRILAGEKVWRIL